MPLCDELLRGAIDLHQHAALSLFDRITDDIGLAGEARQRGMRGVLLKAHEQDTTGRAALVRRQVRMFVQMLLERGFSPEELRTMVVSNPARLLGLD